MKWIERHPDNGSVFTNQVAYCPLINLLVLRRVELSSMGEKLPVTVLEVVELKPNDTPKSPAHSRARQWRFSQASSEQVDVVRVVVDASQ